MHHSYLIEGKIQDVPSEVRKLLKSIDSDLKVGPDFSHFVFDTLRIEDARNLKSIGAEKSLTEEKRVIIISANSFLLEAQNTLLKMFEEPIENTIFFLIVPDKNALLRTLVSRFYVISLNEGSNKDLKVAEDFIKLSLQGRLDYVKELLVENEDVPTEVGIPTRVGKGMVDSPRSKALAFLNSVEAALHKKLIAEKLEASLFEHIFKVRKFLRMPGSSAKSLMESVALVIPAVL